MLTFIEHFYENYCNFQILACLVPSTLTVFCLMPLICDPFSLLSSHFNFTVDNHQSGSMLAPVEWSLSPHWEPHQHFLRSILMLSIFLSMTWDVSSLRYDSYGFSSVCGAGMMGDSGSGSRDGRSRISLEAVTATFRQGPRGCLNGNHRREQSVKSGQWEK